MRVASRAGLGASWTLALIVAAGPAAAQDLGSAGSLDVVAVEIPTRVVDGSGQPVRGLTAKNFEVREGKKKLEVVGVEVVDLAQTPEAGGRPWSAPVLSAARRRMLFVFDLSFSSGAAIYRARDGVLEMLDQGLHPSDLVGVARYSAARGVEMVVGLTSDLAQVREAVSSLGVVDPARRIHDPLQLMWVDLGNAMNDARAVAEMAASQGAEPPRSGIEPTEEIGVHLQDLLDEQSKTVRREQARPILDLADGLAGLAAGLEAIPGYKQVVFLSEGFDDSFLTGTRDQERITRLSQATAVSEAFQVDSEELYGGGAVRSALLDMAEAFRRADCSIHAVDIGGLRAAGDARQAIEGVSRAPMTASSEAGLFLMSSETGGRLIRGQNNLGRAMDEVMAQTAVTYVLLLEPPGMVLDGSYHAVEVELKRTPKGARALHRPGYFAPLPYPVREGETRRLDAAERVASGEDGGPVATGLLAAAFPTDGPDSEVLAWVEMYGYGLLQGSPGDRLPVEIFAYAFRGDGSVADFATQAAVVDLRRHRWSIEAQGFKHVVRFELAPGSYYLRVLVRNALTGASGLSTRRLEVPDFSARQARLSVPMFMEADGLWVLGWGQDVSNRVVEEASYPLTYRGRRMVPSADPLLPRGVEAPLLLLGYDLPGAPAALAASLEPVDGGAPYEAQIVLDGFENGAGGAFVWARIMASTATPAGKYRLVVRAEEGGAGRLASPAATVYVR